jgi:hypothetical protein
VLEPAGITRDFAATETFPAVLRLRLAPPALAGPLRVTMQVAEPPGLNEAGLQARELTVRGKLIWAPVALTETGDPWAFDARAPFTPNAIVPDPETVAEAVATTPLAITFWLGPSAMHAYPPLVVTHVNDFPVAVNAGPATMETFVTPCGYDKIHCRPAAAAPLGFESERLRETAPCAPGEPAVKDSVDWANKIHGESRKTTATVVPKGQTFRISTLRRVKVSGLSVFLIPCFWLSNEHYRGYATLYTFGRKKAAKK